MAGLLDQWLTCYGQAAMLLALAFVLGFPFVGRYLAGPVVPLFAILLGLTVLSVVVGVFGWLHLFAGWSVGVVGGLGAVLTAWELRRVVVDRRWRRSMRLRRPGLSATLIASVVLGLVLLGLSVLPLYPSTIFDATSYHLPLAGDLVRHHGLHYDPFVRYSSFPQAGEAAFAAMQLISRNAASSAALEYAVLCASALLIPLWFRSNGRSVVAGVFGALVLLASLEVVETGTGAMVDTWTMAFVLAALLCGLNALAQTDGRPGAPRSTRTVVWVLLAGAFLGQATASKYTGALYGGCVLVGLLVAAGRGSRAWRAVPAAVGIGCLVAAPWYAWTLHTTGDPLYPFAVGLFGAHHGLWTAAEIQLQDAVARLSPKPGIASIVGQDVRYLTGSGFKPPLSWWLGTGVLGLSNGAARRDRQFVAAFVASLLSIIASLFLSADPRYLLPAVGSMAIAAAIAADTLVPVIVTWTRRTPMPRTILTAGGVALVAAVMGPVASYARGEYAREGLPPSGSGKIQAFLSSRLACYAAIDYLNHHAEHFRAWAYSCEQDRYYAKGLLISDAFSTGARDRIFNDNGTQLPSPQVLWQRLEPLRVDWAVLPLGTPRDPRSLAASGWFRYLATVRGENIYRVVRR